MGLWAYAPLEIGRSTEVYSYPIWSNVFGWVIAASSAACIPIAAMYYILKAKGSFIEVFFSCELLFKAK